MYKKLFIFLDTRVETVVSYVPSANSNSDISNSNGDDEFKLRATLVCDGNDGKTQFCL